MDVLNLRCLLDIQVGSDLCRRSGERSRLELLARKWTLTGSLHEITKAMNVHIVDRVTKS